MTSGSVVRARLAQRPRLTDVVRFVSQLRHPTRTSTLRAAVDGLVVAGTLRRRGARPLLENIHNQAAVRDLDRSLQVSTAVDAGLGVLPMAATCLRRSVTLLRELNRLGLAATLHIGVRTAADAVEAHAWVQVADVVINDDPCLTKTYAELAAGELERLTPLLR